MEHLFDSLSKELARVSRRQAIGTFVRGAVGALVASTWFGSRSAQAQSAACTTCGTCQVYDSSTGAFTSCANACEAQVVCNAIQSYHPYSQLAAMLPNINGLQATGYNVLLFETPNYNTAVFQTTYASSQDLSTTADLFVVLGPAKGEVMAYAINYQNGVPTYAYGVGASCIEQIVLPPPPPSSPGPVQTRSLAVNTSETCDWMVANICNNDIFTNGLCASAGAAIASLLSKKGLVVGLIGAGLAAALCTVSVRPTQVSF